MADKEIFDLGKIANLDEPSLGYYVCITPTKPPGLDDGDNKEEEVNYTSAPGKAAGLYYSLFFQLPKWGWSIAKADEWIEVSPTHKEYYERTISSKQMLESTIKTGLTSAAQSVADYELMNHDLRQYKEILGYFNSEDEHSLKAMFVDQVDVHTDSPGQPVSMRSIAPRWPTIIADFMRLSEGDDTPDKVQKKLDVSKAEAVILVTKNKLYKNWKGDIKNISLERYEMLRGMVAARKKTVEEYKEWLKPYISRFQMTRLGGERAGVRAYTHESSSRSVRGVDLREQHKGFFMESLEISRLQKASTRTEGRRRKVRGLSVRRLCEEQHHSWRENITWQRFTHG